MTMRNLGLASTALLVFMSVSAHPALAQNQAANSNPATPKTAANQPQNRADSLGPSLEINANVNQDSAALSVPSSSVQLNQKASSPQVKAPRPEALFEPQRNRGAGIIKVDTP